MSFEFNLTQVQGYTQEQLISYAHKITAVPALIIFFIGSMLISLIAGMLLVNNKSKYLTIWIFSFIASGILLAVLIFVPNTVHDISKFILNFFNI